MHLFARSAMAGKGQSWHPGTHSWASEPCILDHNAARPQREHKPHHESHAGHVRLCCGEERAPLVLPRDLGLPAAPLLPSHREDAASRPSPDVAALFLPT